MCVESGKASSFLEESLRFRILCFIRFFIHIIGTVFLITLNNVFYNIYRRFIYLCVDIFILEFLDISWIYNIDYKIMQNIKKNTQI